MEFSNDPRLGRIGRVESPARRKEKISQGLGAEGAEAAGPEPRGFPGKFLLTFLPGCEDFCPTGAQSSALPSRSYLSIPELCRERGGAVFAFNSLSVSPAIEHLRFPAPPLPSTCPINAPPPGETGKNQGKGGFFIAFPKGTNSAARAGPDTQPSKGSTSRPHPQIPPAPAAPAPALPSPAPLLLLVTFPLIPSPCRVCFQGLPTVNFVASPGGGGITIPWGINSITSPGHPRVVWDVNPTPKVSLPRTRPAPSAQRSQPLPHGVFISEIRAEITPPQISQLVSVLNCTFGPPSTEGTI